MKGNGVEAEKEKEVEVGLGIKNEAEVGHEIVDVTEAVVEIREIEVEVLESSLLVLVNHLNLILQTGKRNWFFLTYIFFNIPRYFFVKGFMTTVGSLMIIQYIHNQKVDILSTLCTCTFLALLLL